MGKTMTGAFSYLDDYKQLLHRKGMILTPEMVKDLKYCADQLNWNVSEVIDLCVKNDWHTVNKVWLHEVTKPMGRSSI